jgi:hypothetical protein
MLRDRAKRFMIHDCFSFCGYQNPRQVLRLELLFVLHLPQ